MALPTKKRSKTIKRIKQYKNRLSKKGLSVCPKCKKSKLPHHICPFCGTYLGREVIKIGKNKKEKSVEKQKIKENK
jgi:large subunit ribosomal protein L32